MEHGVVTNWEDMERLWQFVFAEENLNLAPEGQPVRGFRFGWQLLLRCVERVGTFLLAAGPADRSGVESQFPPRTGCAAVLRNIPMPCSVFLPAGHPEPVRNRANHWSGFGCR
jgi:hypothetical protein